MLEKESPSFAVRGFLLRTVGSGDQSMTKAILRGSQLKDFRKKVSILKRLGLVSNKIDARSQKSTRYMRDQVEIRFAKVLSGHEIAVKVPRRKDAKRFASGFDTKGKIVIVPNNKHNISKPRFSKKTGQIVATRKEYGKLIKSFYEPFSADDLSNLPRGKNVTYSIPLGHGFYRNDDLEQFIAFMTQYESGGHNHHAYKDWRKYVTVEEVDHNDNGEESDF